MLENAQALIEMAENNQTHESLLCACSVIVSAESLEQGIFSSLKLFGEYYSSQHGVPFEDTPVSDIMAGSLRYRMLKTPETISEQQYSLNRESPYLEYLHDLISKRNLLLHIEEDATTLVEGVDDEVIELIDGLFVIPVMEDEPVPWNQVTLAEARRSLAAVSLYEQEVNSLPMEPGELLAEASA
ncbi:MAG: hypothetical protein R3191_02030 [Anaerolineales bacterium]|nr:hypothetical protein [Anaerolineales bacterium]